MARINGYPESVQPGLPKLPELPQGWEVAPLGKYLKEVRRPIKLDGDTQYCLVTVKRARGGVVQREYLSGKEIKVKSQFHISSGDFLISKRQIVHGACGLVPDELDGAIVSNEYAVLRSSDNLLLSFLAYLSESIYFQQTCFHSSIGVHIEKMLFKLDRWFNWKFNIPPVWEQKRIVEILSTWDRAIDCFEKLIAVSENQLTALREQLLSSQVNSQLRPGWQIRPLGEMADIYDGTHTTPDYQKSGVPFYSVEHVMKNDFSSTKFIAREVFERERVRIEKGDVLMTRIGDIGTSRYIDWDVEASFYVSLALIKSRPPLNSSYLHHYICTRHFQTELYQRTIHVAFPKKINLGEVGKCIVAFPAPGEQEKIARILSVAEQDVSNLKLQMNYLVQEKRALMQQLLIGKRRVSGEAVAGPVAARRVSS